MGFGIGFGFYGAYCLCDCGRIIWRQTDCDDLSDEEIEKWRKFDEEFNATAATPTGAEHD